MRSAMAKESAWPNGLGYRLYRQVCWLYCAGVKRSIRLSTDADMRASSRLLRSLYYKSVISFGREANICLLEAREPVAARYECADRMLSFFCLVRKRGFERVESPQKTAWRKIVGDGELAARLS